MHTLHNDQEIPGSASWIVFQWKNFDGMYGMDVLILCICDNLRYPGSCITYAFTQYGTENSKP